MALTPEEQKRDKYYRRTYGLTLAQYERMLRRQRGACALCFRTPKPGRRRLAVDHDHKTGRVRGLLDFFCNRRLLGRGRENPDHHERAAAYLRSRFDGRKI